MAILYVVVLVRPQLLSRALGLSGAAEAGWWLAPSEKSRWGQGPLQSLRIGAVRGDQPALASRAGGVWVASARSRMPSSMRRIMG
jgi:hypothetical protein